MHKPINNTEKVTKILSLLAQVEKLNPIGTCQPESEQFIKALDRARSGLGKFCDRALYVKD